MICTFHSFFLKQFFFLRRSKWQAEVEEVSSKRDEVVKKLNESMEATQSRHEKQLAAAKEDLREA